MTARPVLEDFLARLPAGERRPDEEAAGAVRAYLAAVREHLRELQRAGASGATVNLAHADLVDRLVRRLVRRAEAIEYAEHGAVAVSLAIAAVGGYGRREMSIDSDVDLLLLHGKRLEPQAESIAKRVQLWLWDAGVTLGGAVRDAASTVTLAREDLSVLTAVLDARFLSGDTRLFQDFVDLVRRKLLRDPASLVRSLAAARADRHAKYGESLYLLQPNLKEGAGGLRDYHSAHWAARATLPDVRGLDDLLHHGLLTENETEDLGAALDFLWRVRNELHLLVGRKNDQMSFEHQEEIANALGYEARGAELPVERFMGAYYRHARHVQGLSEIVIEQCEAWLRRKPSRPRTREVDDGFLLASDHLEIPHGVHLRERPVRLLTAFAVAQQHDVPLSRTAQRLVRENLDLIDEGFRRDPEAAATLLRVLDSEHRVMRTLALMNETGLLGAYLPEWDHIVCRWQHVIYHTYTVDVHSIFLVEELRRLWRGKCADAHPELTELVRAIPDRAALFLGCLLHDIGKGLGGDHSNKGELLARACLERIGLEKERRERVCFLVKHHLLMSHVAQRRDLSDPRVITELARICGDRENLRNLYLVTFADIRASSKKAWTDWKGQLLAELFERTAEFLESGRDDPRRALEQIDRRVETRRARVREELRELGVAEDHAEQFFEMMPRRYFVAHTPAQIARHAQLVLAHDPERLFSTAVREMRAGFSELIVSTRDVPALYANVAGSLTAANINILGSHVYTTRTGLALEVYRVTTPAGGDEEKAITWRRFEQTLTDVLEGRVGVAELMGRRKAPIGRQQTPSRQAPTVEISNDESDFYTIVDVAANDRLGLLFDLASTISAHGLEIYLSKAATILDQVADSFYVKDREGHKLTDPARVAGLQRDLLEVTRREGAGE